MFKNRRIDHERWMRYHVAAIIAALAVLTASFAETLTSEKKRELEVEVSRLGHRNMIIVADSAYPIQTGTGVRVILTNADHLSVVRHLAMLIDQSKAVRPLIAIDKEFAFVPEEFAPGAGKLREDIMAVMEGKSAQPIREVLHEELLGEVNALARDFEVVVFKTTGIIPYSSVFFTLDCGYWSAEAEAALRKKMENTE